MSTYFPKHEENRMRDEGNIEAARSYFQTGKNRVLYRLIEQRFSWMNDYIKDSDTEVIELGCGAGLSRNFIKNTNLRLTDVSNYDWVDEYVDALQIKYPDNSVDVFICSEMIHHIASPAAFLDSLSRKLKRGGRVIIQDIYTCGLMKLALRVMRHEGWSDEVDIFDRTVICNDPADPWSANCSIPKLLFWRGGNSDGYSFTEQFPQLKIVKRTRNECFLFFTSGGVIAKTYSLPLGEGGVKIIKGIDRILVRFFPGLFACGCSIVLEKQ